MKLILECSWLFVENSFIKYDITSSATIRQDYVERQFVECTSVENLSKARRKLVENENSKMKASYQNRAMRMRLKKMNKIE